MPVKVDKTHRGYQGLQSLAEMGLRFGLNPNKRVHKALLKGLRDWWDHGIKVGDVVWVWELGNLISGVVTSISPLDKRKGLSLSAQLEVPRHLGLSHVTIYDVDHLFPNGMWGQLQDAVTRYRRALWLLGSTGEAERKNRREVTDLLGKWD